MILQLEPRETQPLGVGERTRTQEASPGRAGALHKGQSKNKRPHPPHGLVETAPLAAGGGPTVPVLDAGWCQAVVRSRVVQEARTLIPVPPLPPVCEVQEE